MPAPFEVYLILFFGPLLTYLGVDEIHGLFLIYFVFFLLAHHLGFNLHFKLNLIIFGVHSRLMEKCVV